MYIENNISFEVDTELLESEPCILSPQTMVSPINRCTPFMHLVQKIPTTLFYLAFETLQNVVFDVKMEKKFVVITDHN